MNVITNLVKRQLASPPDWLVTNTVYLTKMGSEAYGVASDSSDMDVYGACMPPKRYVFPHLYGHVPGFGPPPPSFEQWQEHHVYDPDKGREYDFAVYSLVRYFDLCADMNPNMVDSLFTATDCHLFMTQVGRHMLDHRHHFLSKKLWPKFRGYAFSQLHKLKNKKSATGNRAARIQEMGYDVKNAYHVVRLMNEAEQLLTLGDLDLRRDREMLKDIRRGNWSEPDVRAYFDSKSKDLDRAFAETKLPEKPDYNFLRKVLLECLEMHYGSLEAAVVEPDRYHQALLQVDKVLRDVL